MNESFSSIKYKFLTLDFFLHFNSCTNLGFSNALHQHPFLTSHRKLKNKF